MNDEKTSSINYDILGTQKNHPLLTGPRDFPERRVLDGADFSRGMSSWEILYQIGKNSPLRHAAINAQIGSRWNNINFAIDGDFFLGF